MENLSEFYRNSNENRILPSLTMPNRIFTKDAQPHHRFSSTKKKRAFTKDAQHHLTFRVWCLALIGGAWRLRVYATIVSDGGGPFPKGG